MKLIFTIALRYVMALRRASTVQILSLLSVFGVLLGSMAMLIVLSAFNGFEGLLRRVYHHQDPDLRILPIAGKSFQLSPEKIRQIQSDKRVAGFFEVLCDKTSVQFGDGQMVAEVFAADPAYFKLCRMDTTLIAGSYQVKEADPGLAMVSEGIRQALQISFSEQFTFLKLAYPKRSKILKPGSGKIFNTRVLKPAGSLGIDENRVYIPLSAGRALMERHEGCHFADIFLREGSEAESLIPELEKILGPKVVVLNENQLHQDLFKVMKIEKLFVFLALGFIILISGFNLFVSSSMMVINKRKDFAILAALGMQARGFSGIIRATGLLLVSAGLVPGLGLGALLCFLQMKYGFIPLGMRTTMVKAYPVELHFTDAAAVAIWVLASAFLSLIVPASRAAAEKDLKI